MASLNDIRNCAEIDYKVNNTLAFIAANKRNLEQISDTFISEGYDWQYDNDIIAESMFNIANEIKHALSAIESAKEKIKFLSHVVKN